VHALNFWEVIAREEGERAGNEVASHGFVAANGSVLTLRWSYTPGGGADGSPFTNTSLACPSLPCDGASLIARRVGDEAAPGVGVAGER
jgi:hypothetical protein